MADILGEWENIIPLCGNHEGHVRMEPIQGPHSMFYACPKYYPKNRAEGERACNNRINLIEYEAMVSHLNGIIADAMLEGGDVDLTNHEWRSKGISYMVEEHGRDKIAVRILNKKAMAK